MHLERSAKLVFTENFFRASSALSSREKWFGAHDFFRYRAAFIL